MRRKLIAANWKMHKTISEAVDFVKALETRLPFFEDRFVLIAPPFTALQAVKASITRKDFFLGAQNCHWEEKGAFTGEISPKMLVDVGCSHVIIGHSERRHIFKETDEMINKKLVSALKNGLTPILCIGELLEERKSGKTFEVIEFQLDKALKDVDLDGASRIVIAYEPVWAIGTGHTATPAQAEEAHVFIRKKLGQLFNKVIAESVLILYGGSVKPDNVDELMKKPDIDGLLVGGASLEVESFRRIVDYRL